MLLFLYWYWIGLIVRSSENYFVVFIYCVRILISSLQNQQINGLADRSIRCDCLSKKCYLMSNHWNIYNEHDCWKPKVWTYAHVTLKISVIRLSPYSKVCKKCLRYNCQCTMLFKTIKLYSFLDSPQHVGW